MTTQRISGDASRRRRVQVGGEIALDVGPDDACKCLCRHRRHGFQLQYVAHRQQPRDLRGASAARSSPSGTPSAAPTGRRTLWCKNWRIICTVSSSVASDRSIISSGLTSAASQTVRIAPIKRSPRAICALFKQRRNQRRRVDRQFDRRDEQVAFGTEVVVDQRRVDAGSRRDATDRRAIDAVRGGGGPGQGTQRIRADDWKPYQLATASTRRSRSTCRATARSAPQAPRAAPGHRKRPVRAQRRGDGGLVAHRTRHHAEPGRRPVVADVHQRGRPGGVVAQAGRDPYAVRRLRRTAHGSADRRSGVGQGPDLLQRHRCPVVASRYSSRAVVRRSRPNRRNSLMSSPTWPSSSTCVEIYAPFEFGGQAKDVASAARNSYGGPHV